MTYATVSNITPRAILNSCSSAGVNVDRFLTEIGINKKAVTDANGRTSFEDVIRLWEESSRLTQNQRFGLDTSYFLPFGAIKVVDFVMVTSPTPKESLSKFIGYYPLINGAFKLLRNTRGDFDHIELHNPADPNFFPTQYVDYVFACVLGRVRFAAGLQCNPREVHFTSSEPKDLTKYHRVFQSSVRFDQPVNQMIFEKDMLDLVQPNSDPYLCELLDCHAQKLIRQLPSNEDVLFELRKVLHEGLYFGEFGLESSARKLGMSRRNLQRKLKAQGFSYRTLLDQIRCDLAKNLLSKQNKSIEETAYLVGYSEQSSFYRAFKRWTGKTPQEFCQNQLSQT